MTEPISYESQIDILPLFKSYLPLHRDRSIYTADQKEQLKIHYIVEHADKDQPYLAKFLEQKPRRVTGIIAPDSRVIYGSNIPDHRSLIEAENIEENLMEKGGKFEINNEGKYQRIQVFGNKDVVSKIIQLLKKSGAHGDAIVTMGVKLNNSNYELSNHLLERLN